MPRPDGRRPTQLRPVEMVRGYTRSAPGSVLIKSGDTVVLCTACWEKGVPKWREGSGLGWVTAEYDMLPGSTTQRRPRNRQRLDGRTQEIQRLIGRSLRAVMDFEKLGENSILIDCDVLQADGGTRTAAVTGAYVALADAVRVAQKNKWLSASPIREAVAAVSVGQVHGRALLDLNYAEDVDADVDMNVVMTAAGRFVEVQGTGERATFSQKELEGMVRLAVRGIRELLAIQEKALRRRGRTG
jgi:ribonuclease PH